MSILDEEWKKYYNRQFFGILDYTSVCLIRKIRSCRQDTQTLTKNKREQNSCRKYIVKQQYFINC